MDETKIVDATRAQAETVIRWLKDEHLNELGGKSGFYCNRSIVRRAARESEMKCLIAGRAVIGFAIFGRSTIDIFEIRPAYRGLGYGRHFAAHIIQMLFNNGAKDIDVECAPAESESFWRSLGFVEQEEKYQTWGGNLKLVLRSNSSFMPRPLRGSA